VAGEEAGRQAQVGLLGGAVLVLAHRAAAGAEPAVVEGQGGEARTGERGGAGADGADVVARRA
jgi:hypothetical protein